MAEVAELLAAKKLQKLTISPSESKAYMAMKIRKSIRNFFGTEVVMLRDAATSIVLDRRRTRCL